MGSLRIQDNQARQKVLSQPGFPETLLVERKGERREEGKRWEREGERQQLLSGAFISLLSMSTWSGYSIFKFGDTASETVC